MSKITMADYKRVMAQVFEASEDEIEYLLWEETAFPMCGIKNATIQLAEFFSKPVGTQVTKGVYTHVNSKGKTYYLNVKEVSLRGGKKQDIYYFSPDLRPEATMLPEGFVINENPRNGFLTIKRPEKL